MPYPTKAVANYFLELADRAGTPIDPIKLQKLVYLAHGWNLALRNQSLINEQIEAWPFGPVIPSLYHEFRRFGDGRITGPAVELDGEDEDEPGRVVYPGIGDGDEARLARQLLDRVWNAYGDYTSIQLSNLTHEQGTPWDRVWNEYQGQLPRGTDIPASVIREYFLKRVEESRRRRAAAS